MSNVTINAINEVNSNVSKLSTRVDRIEEKLDRILDLVKCIESKVNAPQSVTRVYYDNQHDQSWRAEHY